MSIATPHNHLGFRVHFDELEPAGVITMRSSTWEALKLEAGKNIKFHHEHESDKPAGESTTIDATSVGPISGPDAGTGPLVPAVDTPPMEQPAPTEPPPAAPTEVVTADSPAEEPSEDAELPEATVQEAPLPEHPAIENQPPETPESEWLRKEAEAKEHHEG